MNKSLSLFMLSSIVALNSSVDAWSKNGSPLAVEDASASNLTLQDNRSGLVEVDYLFWKPYIDELDYTTKTVQETDNTGVALKIRPKTPHFDLSSGVRVGIGGYTSDVWDIKLKGTYYYSDSSSSTHGDGGNTPLFASIFSGLEGEQGSKASALWRLNFGLLDFTIGREFAASPKFNVHPFIGIRNVWIRQNLNSNFSGLLISGSNPAEAAYSKNHLKNHTWGIGPRVGLDLSFYFVKGWSLRGGLSGAFVYGNYHVKQKANLQITQSSGSILNESINLKKSDHLIRSNFDAYFGIGWDRWFNQNKNRVYVALLCETSYWYQINQLVNTDRGQTTSSAGTGTINTYKREGDLGLFGGTIHFQVDF